MYLNVIIKNKQKVPINNSTVYLGNGEGKESFMGDFLLLGKEK